MGCDHGFRRIALAGNEMGVRQLVSILPPERVACIIAPATKPSKVDALGKMASAMGLPLIVQPRWKSPEYGAFVGGLRIADSLISNNYSMIIRPDVLQLFGGDCLNVHWALLPENRGSNPVQWAIIRGLDVTGVTLHFMEADLDTGDIVAQVPVPIDDLDTWRELAEKLELAAYQLLARALPQVLVGNISRTPQEVELATSNERLNADSPRIDWSRSDREIYNLIRAQVAPLAGAYAEVGGVRTHFPVFIPLDQIAKLRRGYTKLSPDTATQD